MKKDVVVYFISKVIVGLFGILLIKLYSTLLDPSSYGEFSLISGLVSALVSIFIGWIGSSSLRYFDEYKNNKKFFFTNIIIYIITMILVVFTALVVLSIFVERIPISKYLLFVLFFTVAVSLQDIFEKILRADGKTVTYSILVAVQSIASLGLFYLFANVLKLDTISIFLSSAISKMIFVVVALIALGVAFEFKYIKLDKKLLKKFLQYGIPMIGIWGVGWILNYCDRYIIAVFNENYDVGIYDISCKISENTINIIVSAFTLAVFPALIRIWNNGGRDKVEGKMTEVFQYYFFLVLPAVTGLALISPKLYLGILDKQYESGAIIIIIYSIGVFFNGFNSLLNKIWQLNEKTNRILIIMIISVILNIVLNIIFIPIFGIVAAAVTTVASYLITSILTFYFIRKEFTVRINYSSLIKTVFSCIVMGTFIFYFNGYVSNMLLLIVEIIISILIYAIMTLITNNVNIINIIKRKMLKHE